MKKLLAAIIVLLGFSFQSNAAEHPWLEVRHVIHTYQVDAGKFQQISKEEQAKFYSAANMMKGELSKHTDFISKARVKEIDATINVFRFIWESKPEFIEIDLGVKAPELI
ncbi:hypothetical protein [uncultured Arcticibacterium sp.]|uniref:hypothetical protein n=1 Tax=uncultured Arcticibacterium sp. TaxID=2173042 RepID=UPI0030FCFA58